MLMWLLKMRWPTIKLKERDSSKDLHKLVSSPRKTEESKTQWKLLEST